MNPFDCSEIILKSNKHFAEKQKLIKEIELESEAAKQKSIVDIIENIKKFPNQVINFKLLKEYSGDQLCIDALNCILDHRAPYQSEITQSVLHTVLTKPAKEVNKINLINKMVTMTSDPNLLSMILFYATPHDSMYNSSSLVREKIRNNINMSHGTIFNDGCIFDLQCLSFSINIKNTDGNDLIAAAEGLINLRAMNYQSIQINTHDFSDQLHYCIIVDWNSGALSLVDRTSMPYVFEEKKLGVIKSEHSLLTRETNFNLDSICEFLIDAQDYILCEETKENYRL